MNAQSNLANLNFHRSWWWLMMVGRNALWIRSGVTIRAGDNEIRAGDDGDVT
ncbi:MAG: hypothetical protein IPL83_07460 [Bdellovibrionales bacterium]|nr:hypothetical protein [Bdellovibrionales bacterium]